jgi:SNF2 family DNA or RNA helicase
MILNETSYFGAGSIAEVVNEIKKRALKKTLVVTDPDLLKFNVTQKVTALLELLQTIIDGNGNDNAVLVFSQFTTYLAQIQKALQEANIPYLYIDGTVPITQRQQLVERFQKGECPVFLISLKAGGLGLNLTRANYVIHMDPWWNPAIEAQATDRSHRIGQSRAVTVYHLISQGTIEEKIQRLHERKQNLATGVLAATDMSYKLTGEELLQMVRGE